MNIIIFTPVTIKIISEDLNSSYLNIIRIVAETIKPSESFSDQPGEAASLSWVLEDKHHTLSAIKELIIHCQAFKQNTNNTTVIVLDQSEDEDIKEALAFYSIQQLKPNFKRANNFIGTSKNKMSFFMSRSILNGNDKAALCKQTLEQLLDADYLNYEAIAICCYEGYLAAMPAGILDPKRFDQLYKELIEAYNTYKTIDYIEFLTFHYLAVKKLLEANNTAAIINLLKADDIIARNIIATQLVKKGYQYEQNFINAIVEADLAIKFMLYYENNNINKLEEMLSESKQLLEEDIFSYALIKKYQYNKASDNTNDELLKINQQLCDDLSRHIAICRMPIAVQLFETIANLYTDGFEKVSSYSDKISFHREALRNYQIAAVLGSLFCEKSAGYEIIFWLAPAKIAIKMNKIKNKIDCILEKLQENITDEQKIALLAQKDILEQKLQVAMRKVASACSESNALLTIHDRAKCLENLFNQRVMQENILEAIMSRNIRS